MCYQKKVVRRSLYQKAIDPREQRAKWACLHAHLATAARVNTPVSCSGGVDLFQIEEQIRK